MLFEFPRVWILMAIQRGMSGSHVAGGRVFREPHSRTPAAKDTRGLFPPWRRRHADETVYRHGSRLPHQQQLLECVGRKIGEPHGPAHEPFRHTLQLCQITCGGDLTAFHTPPPSPGSAKSPQDMGILGASLMARHIIGRQDLGPPVAPPDGERDNDTDVVIGAFH